MDYEFTSRSMSIIKPDDKGPESESCTPLCKLNSRHCCGPEGLSANGRLTSSVLGRANLHAIVSIAHR